MRIKKLVNFSGYDLFLKVGFLIVLMFITTLYLAIQMQRNSPSIQVIANLHDPPFYSIGSPELSRLISFHFQPNKVYHFRGIAYDQYSIDELGQLRPGSQWLAFPLPHEIDRVDYPIPWWNSDTDVRNRITRSLKESPPTKTTLAYIDEIHVISDKSFVDRHDHLKLVFHRHNIPIQSIIWRFKWNRTTCNSKENHEYVRKRLNMKPGRQIRANQCPIIMKHVDIWYDIAIRQIPLALILEDDPLFVPFFKEKLNRVIYTAIRTGALRINKTCIPRLNKPIRNDEWIEQEPMLVIGACFDMHDKKSFQLHQHNASPVLSTHKQSSSRCAHAYLLTACSARAMIEELIYRYTEYDTPDFWMNHAFSKSYILQSFWIDPPLVYQGNRVDYDLDQLKTFKETKYNLPL